MRVAEVSLGQVRVGFLQQLEDYEYVFSWEEAYLRHPIRPVLGQRLEDRIPNPMQSSGLPLWFAHLLPQGVLKRALHRSLNTDEDDFLLLVGLGQDLPGAVRVSVTDDFPAPFRRKPVVINPGPIRFSLAGMQPKLSFHDKENRLTLPLEGEESAWIGKFATDDLPQLVQIEFATMSWARASGIEVPEIRLVENEQLGPLPEGTPLAATQTFLIRRFDRIPGLRIHMEDFAQILDLPPSNIYQSHYEHIAAVLGWLVPLEDRVRFLRQLVFCLVCGNGDAHAKNWSLLYPDGRNTRLSPAYDIVATRMLPRGDPNLALKLGGAHAWANVTDASFQKFSALHGWKDVNVPAVVQEQIDRSRAALSDIRDLYTAHQLDRLQQHWKQTPLLRFLCD